MKLNEKETLRYLGYGNAPPDPAVLDQIRRCERMLESLRPKSVWIREKAEAEEAALRFAGRVISSRSLADHMRGCGELFVFAATLGAEADRLLARASQADISQGAVLQAGMASMLESYCDDRQAELAALAAKEGYFLRPRFSPGYGDFPITYQRDLLALTQASKKIGLAMTDSFMLTPTKSVTALIGLAKEPDSCHIEKCRQCPNEGCALRRD